MDHRCAYAGKSIKGQVIEDQASLIFADFTLRDDWVDWVIENHVNKSDLAGGGDKRWPRRSTVPESCIWKGT